jgi:hypothetical protein
MFGMDGSGVGISVHTADIWQFPCLAIEYALHSHVCKASTFSCTIVILIPEQIVHLIFSWSSFLSWLIFICDLGLIGFLSMRAYRDGKLSQRS